MAKRKLSSTLKSRLRLALKISLGVAVPAGLWAGFASDVMDEGGLIGVILISAIFAAVMAVPIMGIVTALMYAFFAAQRGVQSAQVLYRTAILTEAPAKGLARLREANALTQLPKPLPVEWWIPGTLWRRIRYWLWRIFLLHSLGLFLALVAFPEVRGWNVGTVGWIVSAALLLIQPRNLAKAARTRLAKVLTIKGDTVLLPSGHAVDIVSSEDGAALNIGVMVPQLTFSLRRTERDTLDESKDFNIGDSDFDQATVMLRTYSTRADLWSSWLTPLMRDLLLWSIALNLELTDARLGTQLDLTSSSAMTNLEKILVHLQGLLTIIDTMPQDLTERAWVALDTAKSDVERRCLLKECQQLSSKTAAHKIYTRWASEGQGETRVDAAEALPRAMAKVELVALAVDGHPLIRSRALGALMYVSQSAAILQLVTAIEAGDLPFLIAVARKERKALKSSWMALSEQILTLTLEEGKGLAALLILALTEVTTPPTLDAQWLAPPRVPVHEHSVLCDLILEYTSEDTLAAQVKATQAIIKTRINAQRGGLSVAEISTGGLALAD